MNFRVRFPRAAAVSSALALCLLHSPGVQAQAAPSAKLEEITVLTPAPPTLPGFAPWVLAQYKGYYREQGLNVNLVAANGGGVEVAKMVGAGAALAGSSVGDAPLLLRANGIPIKVVAVLGGRSLMQVAVRADNDQIKSPADLKGKTVTAGTYSDSIYYSFLGMLSRVGLKRNDPQVQAAGPTGVWQLFAQGKADAMIGTPDWVLSAVNAGTKVKVFQGEDYFPSLPQAIVVSDKLIAERPELVRRLVAATLRSLKDVMDDPKAASAAFVQAVPSYKGRQGYVEQILTAYAQHVYPGQKVLGQMDAGRLKAIQELYLKEGIVREKAPLTDFYTDRFVPGMQ